MGAVYEATDGRLGGPCAVKEMLDVFSGDDADLIRRKFAAEASLLCQLRHPGIPSVRDYFQAGNTCYIVMDLVHGANLGEELEDYQKLTGANFPLETVLELATQILKILEYLHFLKPPIIHRDIKPANLIREYRTGQVKLVDFGLARSVEGDRSQTLIGTLGYCPLEQMQGKAEPRSDLYALGATMHHLLTGELPQPMYLPRLENVPPGVADLVARATQTQAQDRFADALQMRQAIQRLDRPAEPEPARTALMPAPPTAPLPAPTGPLTAPVAPPAPGASWLVAAAAGLALLVGGIWLGQRRSVPRELPAPLAAADTTATKHVLEPSPVPTATPVPSKDYVPRRQLAVKTPAPPPPPVKQQATPRPRPTEAPRQVTATPTPFYPQAVATVKKPPPAAPISPRTPSAPDPPPQPAETAQPTVTPVSTGITCNWPDQRIHLSLGPEWTIRRQIPYQLVIAERNHDVAYALELTVTAPRWNDFKGSADQRKAQYRKQGWTLKEQVPHLNALNWEVAALELSMAGTRSYDFMLLSPRVETLSLEIQSEQPPQRLFYSVRVGGSSRLNEEAALEAIDNLSVASMSLRSLMR